MKSYVAPPFEILHRAAPIAERGATTIAVVDSAGGMLPDQVADYVRVLKAGLDVQVGFHGHNNLLLANANSLAAVQAGAAVIDTTLLGIGRGGGNAQTETMLVVLEKAGYPTGINPLEVSEDRRAIRQPETHTSERGRRARADLRIRALPQRLHEAREGRRCRVRRALPGSDARGQPVRQGESVAGADRGSGVAAAPGRPGRDSLSEVHPSELELNAVTRLQPPQCSAKGWRRWPIWRRARTRRPCWLIQQFPTPEDAGVLFPHVRESIANIMAFVELGNRRRSGVGAGRRREAFNWIVVDCDQKLPGSAEMVDAAPGRASGRSSCSFTATTRSGSTPGSTSSSGSRGRQRQDAFCCAAPARSPTVSRPRCRGLARPS